MNLTWLTITALGNACGSNWHPQETFWEEEESPVHHYHSVFGMCDGWVLYLPVPSSHYWIRSCGEGWWGCCGDRNIHTLMRANTRICEFVRITTVLFLFFFFTIQKRAIRLVAIVVHDLVKTKWKQDSLQGNSQALSRCGVIHTMPSNVFYINSSVSKVY